MGQARHLLSLLVIVAALGAAVGGCGSSDEGSTSEGTSGGGATKSTAPPGATAHACTAAGVAGARVSGVSCVRARKVLFAWNDKRECQVRRGASRASCSVGGFLCLGTATGRGLEVSCAKPGRSLSFIARRS